MSAKQWPIKRFGFGRTDWWRRLWMRITLATPPLIGLLGAFNGHREPFPGEYFKPGALNAPWWGVFLGIALATCALATVCWMVQANRTGPRASQEGGTVEVHDDHFFIIGGGRHQRFDKRDIEHVFVDNGATVVVRLRDGRDLRLVADDYATLRDALQPDPTRHAARIGVGSILSANPLLKGLFSTIFGIGWIIESVIVAIVARALASGTSISRVDAIIAMVATIAVALSVPLLRRRDVTVGTDGVRIDGPVFSRFIPHTEIDRHGSEMNGSVTLVLKDGRDVSIPTIADGAGLAVRLHRAKQERDTIAVPAELERGDRDEQTWRDGLAALASDKSYRNAAVRIEDLEKIVDNPNHAPAQRVAAAVALSQDEDRRPKLRIAAEATAEPELKAALEAAAEGELASEHLERAERHHTAL